MLYEILPDPRALPAGKGSSANLVLQIHRLVPQSVPVGHFEANGTEVVDEVVSREEYLSRVQQACARLGDSLELRFFDHFEEEFDASVLDDLSEVRRLAIDGLDVVRSPEAIGRLPKLTSLLFGPRRLNSSQVLRHIGVHRLTHFTLAGTPRPAIDLAPLAAATSLRSLRLLGQGKNAEAIGHITSLSELAIQPATSFSLEFISRLKTLGTLKLVLGRATSISSISGLESLHDLSFREVRLLEDLGDLQRFPRLRRLQISDQPRLPVVRVGDRNEALEHLYLYSVPSLSRLEGFSTLPAVKSLFAYDSQLNLPLSELPRTLTHFQLMTKALRGRDVHEAEVLEKGLTPAVHPDATFFYK
jgi:hypothetical protein